MKLPISLLFTFSFLCLHHSFAQTGDNLLSSGKSAGNEIQPVITPQKWSFHFQQTIIGQNHPAFKAPNYIPYPQSNSQVPTNETQYSLTTTFFFGARAWKGGEIYLNPEISGGAGVGRTLGIAGFPNGETYRVGDPSPTPYIGRVFLRQTVALKPKGDEQPELNEAGANQLREMLQPRRLVFTLGKYCLADIYDNNKYSHDPRTQFLNWSLMSAGAWDYAANTRGYTWGLTAEYITPNIEIRLGSHMMPEEANGPYMDMNIARSHSESLEIMKGYKIKGKEGAVRLIGFYNHARMGNYAKANEISWVDGIPDITGSRAYGRTKAGGAINLEQDLTEESGLFARFSYNDGRNETWVFTEIDRSASIGYSTSLKKWKRANDRFGVAGVVNGLSADHRNYLELGGLGFIIGDGGGPRTPQIMNYAPEMIAETYYSYRLAETPLWISADYQFVANPAYNKNRGPIHLAALRLHTEF